MMRITQLRTVYEFDEKMWIELHIPVCVCFKNTYNRFRIDIIFFHLFNWFSLDFKRIINFNDLFSCQERNNGEWNRCHLRRELSLISGFNLAKPFLIKIKVSKGLLYSIMMNLGYSKKPIKVVHELTNDKLRVPPYNF